MARTILLPAALVIQLALAPAAHAQATGTLTIRATVQSTVVLTVVAPTDRAEDGAVALAAADGVAVPSAIEVRVVVANAGSRDTAFARVEVQPADGMSWRLDGQGLERAVIRIRRPDRWNRSYVYEVRTTGEREAPNGTLNLIAVTN